MAGERSIEVMSGGELLSHVDALGRAQRRCEVQILLAARQHAVINDADSIDPRQLTMPGGEGLAGSVARGRRWWRSSRPPRSAPGWGCPPTPAGS